MNLDNFTRWECFFYALKKTFFDALQAIVPASFIVLLCLLIWVLSMVGLVDTNYVELITVLKSVVNAFTSDVLIITIFLVYVIQVLSLMVVIDGRYYDYVSKVNSALFGVIFCALLSYNYHSYLKGYFVDSIIITALFVLSYTLTLYNIKTLEKLKLNDAEKHRERQMSHILVLVISFIIGLIFRANMWGWIALIMIVLYIFSLTVRLGFIHVSLRKILLSFDEMKLEDTYVSSILVSIFTFALGFNFNWLISLVVNSVS